KKLNTAPELREIIGTKQPMNAHAATTMLQHLVAGNDEQSRVMVLVSFTQGQKKAPLLSYAVSTLIKGKKLVIDPGARTLIQPYATWQKAFINEIVNKKHLVFLQEFDAVSQARASVAPQRLQGKYYQTDFVKDASAIPVTLPASAKYDLIHAIEQTTDRDELLFLTALAKKMNIIPAQDLPLRSNISAGLRKLGGEPAKDIVLT
ncbi:hypothetical protein ACGVWS_16080, partial [Enterobacteriaceae bacterium LUAb1]